MTHLSNITNKNDGKRFLKDILHDNLIYEATFIYEASFDVCIGSTEIVYKNRLENLDIEVDK